MKPHRSTTWTGLATTGLLAFCTACGSQGSAKATTETPAPETPAASATAAEAGHTFSADVTNPFSPLTPGTTLVYKGTKDDKAAVDYFTTTDQTTEINGVSCRLVLDRLFLDDKLAETTADYYTQDELGNVYYYGEDTATIDADGNMEIRGTDGSWHAAEFGAVPGIFMPAAPKVDDTFTQELLAGHAEDHFSILDLSASIEVPYKSFTKALQTKEWTPLEPDVVDNKYFVEGIGMVKEIAIKGPLEELSLVEVRSG